MFRRARRRLTVLYVLLFALIVGAFSVVFFAVASVALQPAFDVGPEPPSLAVAERAYRTALDRIAVVLVLADLAVVALVGAAAWFLAGRTLRPIRVAHDRQRRFVADASHEMRSPIAVVRTSAEHALSTPAGDPERAASLRVIVDASERLGRLTDDLLVLARTESGEAGAPVEDLDLSVLVSEALDERLQATPEPHARVVRRLSPDLVVRADPGAIERIVRNLLENALLYTESSGTIHVTTEISADGAASLTVDDDGSGIAAADHGRVFEPFFRVRSDATAPPGHGLGLAISRALASRLGGRIELESEPGRGARFRLVLPRRRV